MCFVYLVGSRSASHVPVRLWIQICILYILHTFCCFSSRLVAFIYISDSSSVVYTIYGNCTITKSCSHNLNLSYDHKQFPFLIRSLRLDSLDHSVLYYAQFGFILLIKFHFVHLRFFEYVIGFRVISMDSIDCVGVWEREGEREGMRVRGNDWILKLVILKTI